MPKREHWPRYIGLDPWLELDLSINGTWLGSACVSIASVLLTKWSGTCWRCFALRSGRTSASWNAFFTVESLTPLFTADDESPGSSMTALSAVILAKSSPSLFCGLACVASFELSSVSRQNVSGCSPEVVAWFALVSRQLTCRCVLAPLTVNCSLFFLSLRAPQLEVGNCSCCRHSSSAGNSFVSFTEMIAKGVGMSVATESRFVN